MPLDAPLQLCRLCPTEFGKNQIPTPVCNPGKLSEYLIEKKCQPDAFTFPGGAHHVHPVVPVAGTHQRQVVFAIAKTSPDSPYAVFIQTGRLFLRSAGQIVIGILIRVYRAAPQEGDCFIQYIVVASAPDIAADRQGQPEVIVGTVGAHTAAGRRMPPVLNISLGKLPAGGQQNVFTHEPRFGVDERHYVLQLIAKTKGASGLVESAPRPETAGKCLV